MKYIVRNFLLLLAAGAFFIACKKEENKIMLESFVNPVLTASTTSPMVLVRANKDNPVVTFSWTNPNYKFTTGVSSQDVTYTLQFDTTGNNFKGAKLKEVSIARDLSKVVTVGELNSYLLDMNLKENMAHNVEVRVKASLANGSAPLYSNVIKLVVTPYLDVKYPVPAKLFITGSATPASWMTGGDPELASQKFTQVDASTFKITLPLSGGNSFLFVPAYGDWSNKYGYNGSNNANSVYGDAFIPNGGDMKAPPSSGTYTITVDFKTGTYTVQ